MEEPCSHFNALDTSVLAKLCARTDFQQAVKVQNLRCTLCTVCYPNLWVCLKVVFFLHSSSTHPPCLPVHTFFIVRALFADPT